MTTTIAAATREAKPVSPVRTIAWLVGSACVLVAAVVVAAALGPVSLPGGEVLRTLLGLPNGLSEIDRSLLLEIRLPRVVLAVLVGMALASSGAAYQTVFRNPLADPYLLGVAAGAGLGVTIAITLRTNAVSASLPIYATVGAVCAVAVTLALGGKLGRDPVTTVLAGVAVASFATAVQTYVQQRNSDTQRPVFSWILGQLTVSGWDSVRAVGGYIIAAIVAMMVLSRKLDALQLSDDEAVSLGINPQRLRIATIACATVATAAAVSVSGLIGFVGIVVPHLVRYLTGRSSITLLPIITLIGGAFLVLADLGARTLLAPAEVPIGVITAFIGAPFFLFILRTRSAGLR